MAKPTTPRKQRVYLKVWTGKRSSIGVKASIPVEHAETFCWKLGNACKEVYHKMLADFSR